MTQHGLSGIKTSAGNRKGTANQQQRQIQVIIVLQYFNLN